MPQESTTDVTQIETSAQLQACGLELQIEGRAWDKLMGYCRATNLEVSGFMLMVRDGNVMTIKDAYIVEQECTSTSTEMSSTAIAKLQFDLFKAKIIGQDENIKLAHFHTHPTFGVFWSGTDMILRRTMVEGTDYSVALVINQKGEALAAIDINGEFPMSINNLPIEIVRDTTLALECKAEVLLKVKQPASLYSYEGSAGYMRYERDRDLPLTYKGKYSGKRGRPRKNPDDPKWRQIDKDVAEMEDHLLGGKHLSDDEMEALLARRRALADGGAVDMEGDTWSDHTGTYMNLGGEIVKVDEPMPGAGAS